MHMMKAFGVILLCTISNLAASKNPFSKIIIISEKALCSKHKIDKNKMVVSYQDNVHIKLADGTKISSEKLEIEISSKELGNSNTLTSTRTATPVKTILLQNKVSLTKDNRSIFADSATVNIDSSECNLKGNVSIIQNKINTKDIPFKTVCSSALFNWNNETISFKGTKESPVLSMLEIPEQNKHNKYLEDNEQNKSSTKRRSS